MFNKPQAQKPRQLQPGAQRILPASSVQTAAVPAPAAVKPEAAPAAQLLVGPEVKLKSAEILDCDTLIVEGRVEATMDSRVLRIGESGHFAGCASVDVAEIWGRFEGELTARSQLIVHAGGQLSGKIRYGKILIEEGGEVSGEVRALAAASAGEDGAEQVHGDRLAPAEDPADIPAALRG
jgi:cytoskeletal protein CcmA (bactofilin family)